MSSLHVGQQLEIDLFGLNVSGGAASGAAVGTVVALHPGAITIRLNRRGPVPASEVTVSSSRILGVPSME